jgi:beta-glucosidase
MVTRGAASGRYATALPNNLAAASSWDPQTAFEYGALIGRELRDQGYSMSLGGGVNLPREPRNGRTFEYQGEDPLLAGTLVGNFVKGVQSENLIGDLKHYAMNDQESGRNAFNANIDKRSMRETDLLVFQIALGISDAGAVMCSYNRVNGDYACENSYLLADVLKRDFHFKGFVISDWGGTHSTVKASHAGLDQEQPNQYFYGDALKQAVESGEVSGDELNDHVRRILRTIFATGLFDHPVVRKVPDVEGGMATAENIAEKSMVLLKNKNHVLPLDPSRLHSLVLMGGHADVGVLTGGGSAQVDAPGGSPVPPPPAAPGQRRSFVRQQWLPSSPLRALKAQLPSVKVTYVSGENLEEASAAAKSAEVALVFGYQWESEAFDLKSLGLSEEQNRLIEAVATANPRTVVVLETGSPTTMPWVDRVAGVVEAWYPGIRGADALANIITGKVNPSGKLAITFPKSDADLPHPNLVTPPPDAEARLPGPGGDASSFMIMSRMAKGLPPFPVYYDEKLKVGYKWYDSENKPVLFPFGYGLSYTKFEYSGLSINADGATSVVSFTVKNTGPRAGTEIAEVYSSFPESAGEPPKRLIGWTRVALGPGESQKVLIPVSRDRLATYDEATDSWKLVPGAYTVMVGGSSEDLPLHQQVTLR